MQDAPLLEDRAVIAADIAGGGAAAAAATAEDVTTACNIIGLMQQLRRGKMQLPYKIDGDHATYFIVKVRELRTLTSDDCDRIRGLSARIIDVAVHIPAPGRGYVAVAVQRFGPQFQGLVGSTFGPYEAPRRLKRRHIDIDWTAGRVSDGDDRRRITALIDDVYNYQERMPDVTFFFEHVTPQTTTTAGRAGDESDDGTTSEQATTLAHNACGFALCFAGMPDMRFAAFIDWLRQRHGLVPLMYMTFPPAGTEASDATPMFVVHMQRTHTSTGTTAPLRTPRYVTAVPRPSKRIKSRA